MSDKKDLISEAEKSIQSLENGISYSGRRSVYEVDTEATKITMQTAANVIRKLLDEIDPDSEH